MSINLDPRSLGRRFAKGSGTSHDLDFMPDTESAARRGASRFAYILTFGVFCFVVTFLIWSSFATLDEVTRGEARVIPSKRVQVIQNLEGGILREILVNEGQVVSKGDILVRIDNVGADAKYQDADKRHLVLRAAITRLTAELRGKKPEFPKDLQDRAPQAVADQMRLHEARMAQLNSQISVLQSQESQKRNEVAEMRSRQQQLEQSLALAKEERSIAAPLVAKGLMSRMEQIRIERTINDTTGELRTLRIAIPRAEKAVQEARQRMVEAQNSFKSDAATELTKDRAELQSVMEALGESRDRLTRTNVRSPVRGVIQALKKSTVGGVIKPGEDIIEIVPLDDSLVVEAQIRPKDIAFIRPGQKAVVKITAYDYTKYGGLEGKVVDISADTIEDQKGNRFYRVRVRTNRGTLGTEQHKLAIIPGMTAIVEILTGHKTVLEYLLKPLRIAQERAFRER